MVTICICGGGSLGHVCAGVLASQSGVRVNIFTQKPERWNKEICVSDIKGVNYKGHLNVISDDPSLCISESDIVFLCLPGYAINGMLKKIQSYITPKTIVGSIVSSTGFFFNAHEILSSDTKLFGFQRVPYIARIIEYGQSASLLGYKKNVAISTENIENTESFRQIIEQLFLTPTILLNNFYEASLTNSNPILHTGRLYSMFKDWNGELYDHNILFYKEWTDDASQIVIDMDNEFMQLLDKLPVDKKRIPTLLDYYESTDAGSLTHKISSIPAFQTILSPMKEVNGGWIPNFESRYFSEDFPFGLKFIKDLTHIHQIETPNIDKVYDWGMSIINHTNR